MESSGRPRAWLARRGVETNSLERLPVGVLPDAAQMETLLRGAGFRAQQIEASCLSADPRLSGRLVRSDPRPARPNPELLGTASKGQAAEILDQRGPWKQEASVGGLDVALRAIDDAHDTRFGPDRGSRRGRSAASPGFSAGGRHRRLRLSDDRLAMAALGGTGCFAGCLGVDRAKCAPRNLRLARSVLGRPVLSPEVYAVPPDRFAPAHSLLQWVRLHGCEAFWHAIQQQHTASTRRSRPHPPP